MVAPDVDSLVLILAASTVAAFVARLNRRLILPTVVVEIVLGILIGPETLGFADSDPYIEFLSTLGLVFLFFFAGLEVVEKRVPRRALGLGAAGWALSLAIGLTAGTILEETGVDAEGWVLGVALATTALGTLVPILSDAGLLRMPLGTAVLGNGVAGEFFPIVVISVFLTGVYGSVAEVLLLIGFGALVALSGWTALRARPPALVRVLQETVHTTGQAAVRLAILILAALVLLARDVGFDFVLGAFAAGLVVGLVLDTPDGGVVRMRLEGIGFGFLIPIYFVTTGVDFDIDSLLTASGLALAALFLALLFVIRGSAALLWRRQFEPRRTLSLAFFVATGLPLIVAIVDIATDRGAIDPDVGASLVGAGMVSVLVYPFVASRIPGVDASAVPDERSPAVDVSEY